MRFLPPRRWFQVSLSTWFVLVAILAWAMIEWPWVVTRLGTPRFHTIEEFSRMSDSERRLNASSSFAFTGPRVYPLVRRPNTALLYPALALAAFVGLKAAWTVWRRIRDSSAQS